MDSLLGFLLTLGVITGGLALIAARWKSWRPVFKIWLQVLKVSAIVLLYSLAYAMRGVALLLKWAGNVRLGKGGKHELPGGGEQWRRP